MKVWFQGRYIDVAVTVVAGDDGVPYVYVDVPDGPDGGGEPLPAAA